MKSHLLSGQSRLPASVVHELANSGTFDEISNSANSVRHHIYHFAKRDKETNKTWKAFMFVIYQTTRHGPQNGYRLCLVHEGFYIPSPERVDGAPEDDIDRAERPIPQGHEEMIILGEPMVWEASDDEDGVDVEFGDESD